MCPFHAIRKNEGLRRLLFINFLYSFMVAALTVLVPLYLIENNVDLAHIGLLLAIAPLTFMIVRINFASFADELGTKIIDIIYSLSSFFSILLYLVASNTLLLALAIFGESIRNSAFWAVVRTEIIYDTGNPQGALAFFSGVRQFADALGRVSIGFILAFFAFQNSFLLLSLISLVMLYLALKSTNDNHRPLQSVNYRQDVLSKITKKHPKTFWQASLLLGLVVLPTNMLLGYLIPVYTRSNLGFDYGQIGTLVALFSFVSAAVSILSIRWKININWLLLVILFTAPLLVFFQFFGTLVVIPVILAAIGAGCGNLVYEHILLDQIYRSKSVSTDIGVINVPLKLMEIIFLSMSGFVIAAFGYTPLFVILSMSALLFVVFCRSFLKLHH
ncbi:MAG: MFS transporter [Candidatus Micrarchaeota archaeon]